MPKTVLITGGSGMVGQALTKKLLLAQYTVRHFSRKPKPSPEVEVFAWDLEKNTLDASALDGVDAIVHLAGAGIADKPWTEERKKVILESRTQSANLLAKYLQDREEKPAVYISASGISYYGMDTGERWLREGQPAGTDFLSDVCVAWEASADQMRTLGLRTVKYRIGIVLSPQGGALAKIVNPIRWGAGTILGNGRQFLSWIHIDDLTALFQFALENEQMDDVYNAVTLEPTRNADFTRIAARVLKRPLLLPAAPSFALKLVLGDVANLVLGGNRVDNQKIRDTGFSFQYANLERALQDLLVD